jgi:hypothetical protein
MDTLYARAPSLRLDVQILFWTFITVVLRRPVSVNRANAAMRIRRRPESARQPAAPTPIAAQQTGARVSPPRATPQSGESGGLAIEPRIPVTQTSTEP